MDPTQNCDPIRATEQLRLDVCKIRDFIIYSKVCRDSRLIFCQVLPYSRKYSHPFNLETYIKKHRHGVEEERYIDKEDRRKRSTILKKTRGGTHSSLALSSIGLTGQMTLH